MTPYRLVLFHPMDPRGLKLGGIETHIRLLLSAHPEDFSVLMVGIDEIGDRAVGALSRIDFAGRSLDFLPVLQMRGDSVNKAAATLGGSLTLRFAAGALRHLPAIRGAIGQTRRSAEIERYEFALLPKLLRLPSVQWVHNEGGKDDKMDSLMKRYWFVHTASERLALALADRIVAVNPSIAAHIARISPRAAERTDVMSVSVDTRRFRPTPFDIGDGVFRICFAGRLDEFKDPPLMFEVLARLYAKLQGKLEFHYVGATDPARHPEFAKVRAFTVRHGAQDPDGVRAIAARCHAGILTSYFEGLPCYLLEMLASGRPVGAIELPQYAPLILPGVSGALVPRSASREDSAAALAAAFESLWQDIQGSRVNPVRLHTLVAPYSVETQFGRLFAIHRALQDRTPATKAVELAEG
ncbi:MAG: glycosyltransferase [Methylobacteriaceae bacterium]|nr:glycosyltransferase [Methylobacteriaceae bacterium]